MIDIVEKVLLAHKEKLNKKIKSLKDKSFTNIEKIVHQKCDIDKALKAWEEYKNRPRFRYEDE